VEGPIQKLGTGVVRMKLRHKVSGVVNPLKILISYKKEFCFKAGNNNDLEVNYIPINTALSSRNRSIYY